jgi:FkbM family methyltransferase
LNPLVKTFVKGRLAARGLEVRSLHEATQPEARWGINVLELALDRWFARRGTDGLVLLQIGANDGVEEDPVRSLLLRHQLQAYLCEPLRDAYTRLVSNYADLPHVHPLQCAVGVESQPLTLYCLRSDGAARNVELVASFDRDHVENYRTLWSLPPSALVSETVECWRLPDLLAHLKLPSVDIVVVDAEGLDHVICSQALDLVPLPAVLHFEYAGAPRDALEALLARLEASGYVFARTGLDVTALRKGLIDPI